MNRTTKIALGASALVVAGLVALAAPAIGSLGGSTTASIEADAPKSIATPTPTPFAEGAPADGVAARPVAAQEYRERFYASEGYGYGETLDLDGVRELYAQTAAAFPYPLPEGWAFPADPGYYDDPSLGPNWSKALALMRVFNYWEYANVTAAIDAYRAGDTDTFDRLMGVLHDGYVGVLPPNYDPQDGEQWFDNVFHGYADGAFSNYATTFYNPFPYTARG